LTHPRLEAATDSSRLHIRNADDLKRIVQTKLDLYFCDLCLDNRQVFTSEQVLYTRDELREHKVKGDPSGPLKDANFKGHPKCEYATSLMSCMETNVATLTRYGRLLIRRSSQDLKYR
jgi:hypothetical protein